MLQTSMLVAACTGLLLTGYGANEWTHGGVAETMGFGHHHMFDNGGYHCAEPDDALWEEHVAHMHGGDNASAYAASNDSWSRGPHMYGNGMPGPYGDHCGNWHMGDGYHHWEQTEGDA